MECNHCWKYLYHIAEPKDCQTGWFFERVIVVTERFQNDNPKKYAHLTNILPIKWLEISVRSTLGAMAYLLAAGTLFPVGYATKMIHYSIKK